MWWRHRRPQATLWAQLALASVSLLVPRWQPFAGLFVAVYAVTSVQGPRRSARFAPALVLVLLAHSYGAARWSDRPLLNTGTVLGLWLALVTPVVAAGIHRHRQDQQNRSNDRQIREQERRRIARDLHDGLTGAVTSIHLQAAGARAAAASRPEIAHGSLAAIETAAERTLLELRHVVGALRECSAPRSPLHELTKVLELANAMGVAVDHTGDWGSPSLDHLDDELSGILLRTLQETLTNAAKHGGRHVHCAAHLEVTSQQVRLRVHNEVHTPAKTLARPAGWSGGTGLPGLAQRARDGGGHLRYGREGNGFVVELILPRSAGERTAACRSAVTHTDFRIRAGAVRS